MCNRYQARREGITVKFRGKVYVLIFKSVDDIRPTDLAPLLVPDNDAVVVKEMRWGWRVPWDKKPLTNAKSETITTLPAYQPHLHQRCLILADGFYEKGVRFHQPGDAIFAIAGLWRVEPDGQKFTMLTCTPNETVAPYHERMPFLLRPEQFDPWLGDGWTKVLNQPDKSPLKKFEKQPGLF